MEGPAILVQSLTRSFTTDRHGRRWQYHSRSDRHSKVACWGIVFDLLTESSLLRAHATANQIAFGINHEMRDFTTNRKKKLDLVVCTPRPESGRPPRSFADLRDLYGVELTAAQLRQLASMPAIFEAPIGTVRVALEAKAAMTAHVRAIPRLFDELNSSHQTIHAVSDVAIAAGFVMINTATEFISSDLNKNGPNALDVVSRNDAHGAERVMEKIEELPRRSRPGVDGYDAFGVMFVRTRNDGAPVERAPDPDNGGSVLRYDQMIRRIAQLYEARFR